MHFPPHVLTVPGILMKFPNFTLLTLCAFAAPSFLTAAESILKFDDPAPQRHELSARASEIDPK